MNYILTLASANRLKVELCRRTVTGIGLGSLSFQSTSSFDFSPVRREDMRIS